MRLKMPTKREMALRLYRHGVTIEAIAKALETRVPFVKSVVLDDEWPVDEWPGDCPTVDCPAGSRVEEIVEVTEQGRRGVVVGKRGQRLVVQFDEDTRNHLFYPECLYVLEREDGGETAVTPTKS